MNKNFLLNVEWRKTTCETKSQVGDSIKMDLKQVLITAACI
jgi:hypothetical protein